MFENLRDQWKKFNARGEHYRAATAALKTRDAERLRTSLQALGPDAYDGFERFKLATDAIRGCDLGTFRVVLDYLGGDPNLEMKQNVLYGRGTYEKPVHLDYTPLSFALTVRAHDIALHLANDPRLRVDDSLVGLAKTAGMSDVADVLAARVPQFPKSRGPDLSS